MLESHTQITANSKLRWYDNTFCRMHRACAPQPILIECDLFVAQFLCLFELSFIFCQKNVCIYARYVQDVRVTLYLYHQKMSHQDALVSEGFISGRRWYEVDGWRALNQAVGRCIRNRDDYGAILLVDSRFADERNTRQLSKWVRRRMLGNHFSHFMEATRSMDGFFFEVVRLSCSHTGEPFPFSLSFDVPMRWIRPTNRSTSFDRVSEPDIWLEKDGFVFR